MEFELCKSILKIRNYNKPQFYEQILSHFLIPNSLYSQKNCSDPRRFR
ncbi:hypothetical protein LEP1GSC086_1834 [Leptospira weilii str. LNT 1234]|nr:hypothetical protein LEP1GSC086_1834 [Leptospira weilii str. LNT 1234]